MAQRGRPRKTPVAVAETPALAAENASVSNDEIAAMKEQVAYQLAQLLKTAEKLGVNLKEVFPTPPAVSGAVLEAPANAVPASGSNATIMIDGKSYNVTPVSTSVPAPVGPPKAGQYLPGGAWVQWTKNDLNPEDTVTFVPLPIPGMVYPWTDDNGYQKIKLDINGLVCWLTVGAENTINRFFYHVYAAALANHRELEAFKRNGPVAAPWGLTGPDGRRAWQYIPMAATFGMNVDGHSLRVGGPTPLDLTPSEVAAAPAPAGEETPAATS